MSNSILSEFVKTFLAFTEHLFCVNASGFSGTGCPIISFVIQPELTLS